MLGKLFGYVRAKLTRVKKNMWMFCSFEGQYSDNPRYISEKLHEIAPGIEAVWLVKRELLPRLPDYVRGVDIDSPEAARVRASAEVIVDNVYGGKAYSRYGEGAAARAKAGLFNWLTSKRGQHTYTTWHGTPLKRIGRHQIGNDIKDFCCPDTTMILGNRYTLDIMREVTFGKLQMELMGTPRNDILCKEGDREALKKRLGLPAQRRILLYAPTFRNDGKDTEGKNLQRSGIDQLAALDMDRLFATLEKKFGGEWTMICRFHYHVAEAVDWEALERSYPGKFINGNTGGDMAEYLACTDLLITDASSCMFDFALTGRPCILYFPDLENYRGRERGFYVEVEQLPFPVAVDGDALIEAIESFDGERYAVGVKEMLDRMGFVDSEDSSERIVRYILSERK